MPGLILPKHKVATQRIPEYDVDEVQLREPRLMVPGSPPTGKVKWAGPGKLHFALLGNSPIDIVSGAGPETLDRITITPTEDYVTYKSTGYGTRTYATWKISPLAKVVYPYTSVISFFIPAINSGFGCYCRNPDSTGLYCGFGCTYAATSVIGGEAANTGFAGGNSAFTRGVKAWHVVALTSSSTHSKKMFCNGVKAASYGAPDPGFTGASQIYIGNDQIGVPGVSIRVFFIFSGPSDDGLVKELSCNPFMYFVPA